MLQTIASVLITATHIVTPMGEIAMLTPERAAEVRAQCSLGENSTVIDARSMGTAAEIATQAKQGGGEAVIVYGANLAGEDISILLETLEGGCIHSSILAESKAHRATFTQGSLVYSSIEHADWSEADLTGTRFVGVNAENADFSEAVLDGGAWIGAFGNSQLLDADFTAASMRGFAYHCAGTQELNCRVTGRGTYDSVDFTDADISESGFIGWRTFKGATFERTRINPSAVRLLKDVEIGASVVVANGSEQSGATAVTLSNSEFHKLMDETERYRRQIPEFDCDRQETFADQQTCSQWGHPLRRLDGELTKVFQLARRRGVPGIVGEQRLWREKRAACERPKCLYELYDERITELLASLGTEIDLGKDETLRFDLDIVPVPDRMRRSELYKRLLPAIRETSYQTVILTGLGDGAIRLEGLMTLDTGQSCQWNAATEYDPESGWYSARNNAGELVQVFRVWEGKLKPRFDGSRHGTPEEAAEFFDCEHPAFFGTLKLLSET
ncbi:pentapeptide repeat-containing protein [Erythrobacter sp. JK5]|uniref:pentapeptide repeat-containing protein n=1 Tax=Erythrobacter sp. JK5 TaxID=2829500 RepID=UPI001BA716B8|nr:pentapeptide repeat-containing protein [Erythrobacter sp. JK5]QUL36651.1 pentapeptide repeat-containing protein [Erythrobacter sp. JK5]